MLGFHSTKVTVSSNLIVFTQRQVEISQNRNVLSSLPENKIGSGHFYSWVPGRRILAGV